MKYFLVLTLLAPLSTVFSQDLDFNFTGSAEIPPKEPYYAIRATSETPVKKETLNTATTVSDLSPGYAVTWITDYISTEITATVNGETIKAFGSNEAFTDAQKKLLQKIESGNTATVNIWYKYPNPVTGTMHDFNIVFTVKAVPDKQAEFPGGSDAMESYLKTNAISRLTGNGSLPGQAIIKFTVSEKGSIVDAALFQSSYNSKADDLLLQVIRNMPVWRPAQNDNGKFVKQEFEFIAGSPVGGC